jgi:hypothetical protein
MVEVGSSHCQVVSRSLSGKRAVDEQTLASLAVLTERLERLKKISPAFSDVSFSRHVKKLRSRKGATAPV